MIVAIIRDSIQSRSIAPMRVHAASVLRSAENAGVADQGGGRGDAKHRILMRRHMDVIVMKCIGLMWLHLV